MDMYIPVDGRTVVIDADQKKSGARMPWWRCNVCWWRWALAHLRESEWYRPTDAVAATRQEAMV